MCFNYLSFVKITVYLTRYFIYQVYTECSKEKCAKWKNEESSV